MTIRLTEKSDPPLGHAKRRAKIRAALQARDIVALALLYRKHGSWHMYEAMTEDATREENAQNLPELLNTLVGHIVGLEDARDMWQKRCAELAEIKKPTIKPDDIPF